MAKILKANEKGLKNAVKYLKKGKVIIYPTETAYGIGCDLTNKEAIKKIYNIKKRDSKKRLTAIVSDINMAKKFGKLTKKDILLINKFMPGPLTLIVDKKNKFPDLANDNFVFRITSNEFAKKMVKKFGKPVVATSANISGEKSNYKIKNILEEFESEVDLIIDSGNLKERSCSTIAKINKKTNIIRKGPISKKEIEKVISNGR